MLVKDLKLYLKNREQKVTGSKPELVKRAQGTASLKLLRSIENVKEDDNGELRRRKVEKLTTPLGVRLPDPAMLTGWSDNLSKSPQFTEKELYNYLVLSKHRTIDSQGMKANRALRAEVFYKDSHAAPGDHCFVKCLVVPSIPTTNTKKNPDHRVWICLSQITGHVHSADCSCAAG
jgi:hypothetical protein